MYFIFKFFNKLLKIFNLIFNFIIFTNFFFMDSIITNILEETKLQIFFKKLKYCFNHLLIHPFLDLAIIGISYRIIYFILKITGFL
jgi:hypothetical protein